MHVTGTWNGGFETELEDGRGHRVAVDLPRDEDGGDAGTSALELAALSLAGCIATIFALVAKKRRVSFEAFRIELRADRRPGAPTVTSVEGEAHIVSPSAPEDVDTALQVTLRTCPVGVLFERAGVPVTVRSVVSRPGPTLGVASGAEAATS